MAKDHKELRQGLLLKLKTIRNNLYLCKNKTDIDNLTASLLCMTQDFLRHSIQLFGDQFRTQLTLQKGYRDELQDPNLLKEIEIIPETALSNTSPPGANVALLRNLTHQFELFEALKHKLPSDDIIEQQQKLLWTIVQHISKLIANTQIKP